MPPKRQEIPPPAAPPAPLVHVIVGAEPRKPQSAVDFMDSLQTAITDILANPETSVADKLKALDHGIKLAKVRQGVDENDDEGMGFPQR
jgi:hypothetical protein